MKLCPPKASEARLRPVGGGWPYEATGSSPRPCGRGKLRTVESGNESETIEIRSADSLAVFEKIFFLPVFVTPL